MQSPITEKTIHCLLCLTSVSRQGEVCLTCKPRYIALCQAITAYSEQVEPLLEASPHKHISAPMRLVPFVHFFLQKLPSPMLHAQSGKTITHQLAVLSIGSRAENGFQRSVWYGYNLPSTLLAATIDPEPVGMGFPWEATQFVPVTSWCAVLPSLSLARRFR